MKTITIHAAKDLRIAEHPDPSPGPGEVLIQVEFGGICGSDLHYYNHGGFGSVRLKEPMILGHEVAGRVAALGAGVDGLVEGQRVAVSPSRPCGTCRFCQRGMQNHCLNMRFYGSAMPYPHIQGAFRQFLVADASQCVPADGLAATEAAMAEPLSVVLHAALQAGDLLGKRVLVTGCGPIGLLAILVSRAAGAVEIVATDVAAFTLEKAAEIGADIAINVAETPNALERFEKDKGYFDVHFECSGVAKALAAAVAAIAPRGVIAQLGLGGDMTLPVQAMTTKELRLTGSFRFHGEFENAVDMMRRKRVNVAPIVTQVRAMTDALQAFELATDRQSAIKVQLDFT
ncbi:MAG: L-idonate 5-dehydrogenase [Pseudomonadota bacterium]